MSSILAGVQAQVTKEAVVWPLVKSTLAAAEVILLCLKEVLQVALVSKDLANLGVAYSRHSKVEDRTAWRQSIARVHSQLGLPKETWLMMMMMAYHKQACCTVS